MTDWERTAFMLAERLHMTVTQLYEEMPITEFLDWLEYYRESREAAEAAENPLQSGDAMLRAFNLG